MTRNPVSLVALAAALFLAAPTALGQAPKSGDYYEDSVDLGFKVKTPKGWDFIPPSPDEVNLIGKYAAGPGKYLDTPRGNWAYSAWLVKFDRRKGAGEKNAASASYQKKMAKDVDAWLESGGVTGITGWKKEEEDDLKVSKLEARVITYTLQQGDPDDEDDDLALYVAIFPLQEDAEVALVFNAPWGKKWSKFESSFKSMARTFRPVEVEKLEHSSSGEGGFREIKRRALEEEVAKSPGWELYESPNYFIISNNDDKEFIKELMDRLEAIREQYEIIYPSSLAEELLARAKAAKGEKEANEDDDKEEGKTVASSADRMERSRTSVVRVCATKEQYHSYGGPPSSAGYWSSNDKELVVYDAQQGGGRANTWKTTNHEAFHQYIYYFFGSIAPQSWYNEGNGDFYAGYEYKNKKFKLKPFDWRVSLIKEGIRTEKYVPLKELVRFTQGEYYGSNKYGLDGGANYAQGWSFIYFLRTGKKDSKKWNDAWDSILDTYLAALVETDDVDAAVDKAFAGVDWTELETAWKEFKY